MVSNYRYGLSDSELLRASGDPMTTGTLEIYRRIGQWERWDNVRDWSVNVTMIDEERAFEFIKRHDAIEASE